MKKIAVFPGSFDPVTMGHVSVVKKALPLFDKLIIAIGHNTSKSRMFDIEQRLNWLRTAFSSETNVEVTHFEGLTVEFCTSVNAHFIIRGLRNALDFEYEKSIAQMNKKMNPEVETIFIATDPEFAAISSTIIRELVKNNGDTAQFLPEGVLIK